MVVGDILVHDKNLYPNGIGVIDEVSRLTWKEVNNRVNRLANAMRSLGLKKGDVVGIVSENNHVCVEFFFGVAKAALIGVAINYRLAPHQIQQILNDCGAKALLVQDKFTKTIEGIWSSLKGTNILIGTGRDHQCLYDYEALLAEYSSDEPEVEIDENDIMWISYTSGTTGLPKGALFTHKARIENCVALDFCCQLNPGDVVMHDVPVYTYAGILGLCGFPFSSATLIMLPFSAEKFVKMVEQERVKMTIMGLARYKAVREYCESIKRRFDFSSLQKVGVIGGEAASREQVLEMLNFFGVSQSRKVYGGTEMGICTFLTFEDMSKGLSPDATEKHKRYIESAGKPLMGYHIRILDEDDHEVPIGREGELVLKGPGMMSGYLNRPELNAEAFRGEPGWYYSKDIGRFDEDGYLYFVGRKDFMVKTGGFSVFPKEVESVALTHPAIAEAAMFSLPDVKWGNTVNLAVVLKTGYEANEEEIKRYCRKRLAGYQTPKTVHIMKKLPRDPSSLKVVVPELTRMYTKKNSIPKIDKKIGKKNV